MDVVLIAYELRNPRSIAREAQIADAIKGAAADWWHHLPAVWLLAGEGLTADAVHAAIAGEFALRDASPADHLFVMSLVPREYRGFLPKSAWPWFERVMKRKP